MPTEPVSGLVIEVTRHAVDTRPRDALDSGCAPVRLATLVARARDSRLGTSARWSCHSPAREPAPGSGGPWLARAFGLSAKGDLSASSAAPNEHLGAGRPLESRFTSAVGSEAAQFPAFDDAVMSREHEPHKFFRFVVL